MRRRPFFIFIPLTIALAGGAIVMLLWNYILPYALNANPINYWQALGLIVLTRILFGNFNFRNHNKHQGYWREKFRNMSEDDRQKLRDEWKNRCGH